MALRPLPWVAAAATAVAVKRTPSKRPDMLELVGNSSSHSGSRQSGDTRAIGGGSGGGGDAADLLVGRV